VQEYVALVKTRLTDFGITMTNGSGGSTGGAVNGAGGTSGSAGSAAKGKAAEDAKRIIAKYAQSGQIPEMVNQCSIFQARYYKQDLVPALLRNITYGDVGGASDSARTEAAQRDHAALEQARLNLVGVLVKKKKITAESVAAAAAAAAATSAATVAAAAAETTTVTVAGAGTINAAAGVGSQPTFVSAASADVAQIETAHIEVCRELQAALDVCISQFVDLVHGRSLAATAAAAAAASDESEGVALAEATDSIEELLQQIYTTNARLFDQATLPSACSTTLGGSTVMDPGALAAALVPGLPATVASAMLNCYARSAHVFGGVGNDEGGRGSGSSGLAVWETLYFALVARIPWLHRSVVATAWNLCWVHGRQLGAEQVDALSSFALAAWLFESSSAGMKSVEIEMPRMLDCCNIHTADWMHWTMRWGCHVVAKHACRTSISSMDGSLLPTDAAPPLPTKLIRTTTWLIERYQYLGTPTLDPTGSELLAIAVPLLGTLLPHTSGPAIDIPCWLQLELAVQPNQDFLSVATRLGYMQLVLHSHRLQPSHFVSEELSSEPPVHAYDGGNFDHWLRQSCTAVLESTIARSILEAAPSAMLVLKFLGDLCNQLAKSASPPWLVTWLMIRLKDFVAETAKRADCQEPSVYRAVLEAVLQLPAALLVETADQSASDGRPDNVWSKQAASGAVAALVGRAVKADRLTAGTTSASMLPTHAVQHALTVVADTALLAATPAEVVEQVVLGEDLLLLGALRPGTHINALAAPALAPFYRKLLKWRHWLVAMVGLKANTTGSGSGTVSASEQQLILGQLPPFNADVLGITLWDRFYNGRLMLENDDESSNIVYSFIEALLRLKGNTYQLGVAKAFLASAVTPLSAWIACGGNGGGDGGGDGDGRNSPGSGGSDGNSRSVKKSIIAWVHAALEVAPGAITVLAVGGGDRANTADTGHHALKEKVAMLLTIITSMDFQLPTNPSDILLLLNTAVRLVAALFRQQDNLNLPAVVLRDICAVVVGVICKAPGVGPVFAPAGVVKQIKVVHPVLASMLQVKSKQSGAESRVASGKGEGEGAGGAGGGGGVGGWGVGMGEGAAGVSGGTILSTADIAANAAAAAVIHALLQI
jgi:hypothetical protein